MSSCATRALVYSPGQAQYSTKVLSLEYLFAQDATCPGSSRTAVWILTSLDFQSLPVRTSTTITSPVSIKVLSSSLVILVTSADTANDKAVNTTAVQIPMSRMAGAIRLIATPPFRWSLDNLS